MRHYVKRMTFTTEQVAREQRIHPLDLLDSHFSGTIHPRQYPDLVWAIEEVPLDKLDGDYEPKWYYQDEAEYMAALEAAIDAGQVPLPAFIRCGDGYDHADGAHRTVVAIVRGQSHIKGYVARCTTHTSTNPKEQA